jgi:hypothetical protein
MLSHECRSGSIHETNREYFGEAVKLIGSIIPKAIQCIRLATLMPNQTGSSRGGLPIDLHCRSVSSVLWDGRIG